MTARLWAGASGYSFKEWKGTIHPETMKPDGMLACYSERLPEVRFNNTFYPMPKAVVPGDRAAAAPANFRFVVEASRRTRHDARFEAGEAADAISYLYCMRDPLACKRGPVLFQWPPFFRQEVGS